jgi:ACS family glucarate transporter-like MFS transporter
MGPKPPAAFLTHPTRVRLIVLAFACSLSLITYLDRICMMRVKEPIQNDLGLDNPQMGWVFSAFLVGYGLFEVPGGWMGDVWGARRVLMRIVLWWSLFTALTGSVTRFAFDSGYSVPLRLFDLPLLFNSFVLLVLIRFFFGAGEAGAYPNLTRVTRTWFPFHERAIASGGIWFSARMGGFVAPMVIGRLTHWLGWRQAFWVLGLIGLAWSVLFYWWFRDRPEQKDECNEAERNLIRFGTATPPRDVAGLPPRFHVGVPQESISPAPPPKDETGAEGGHGWPALPSLAGFVSMLAICTVSACVSFGWYFIPTWQPQYYKDVYGISYDDSEFLTGLPFLFGAVGCLLGGGVSDLLVRVTGSRRWGRSLLGLVGFTLAGLCIMGMGFTTKPWQAIALLCLANLVNDVAIPVIWAVCADIGGRYVGSVAGLMNFVGAIGGFLSPVMIPLVLKWLPPAQGDWEPGQRWRVIFCGLAGAWFVGAAAWFFVNAGKPLFEEKRAVRA